jgi:hypothetical protein
MTMFFDERTYDWFFGNFSHHRVTHSDQYVAVLYILCFHNGV